MKFTKYLLILLVSAVGLFALSAIAGQTEWKVDKAHSTVGFWVKHLGLSKIKGHFNSYSAVVRADADTGKISWIKASADANSVKTGIDKRDEHLKQADFFDAKKHPKLTLETKSINWNGNSFSGTANLTIKGITRSVPFKGELVGVQKATFGETKSLRAGYMVTAKIDRQKFGLNFDALAEGVSVVDNIVHLEFDVQIYRVLK